MEANPSSRKILYIITKSNFGGAQRYVFELATSMKDLGHQVAVACGGDGELVKKLIQANIPTYKVEGLERDISFFKELKAIFSLRTIIQNYHPDIVHINSSKAGVLGSLTARLLKVPKVIFTAHGWPFLEPRKKSWQIMAWLGSYLTGIFSHQIILVSEHDLKNTHMPLVKSKCSVIHTAVSEFPLLPRDEARMALLPEETINSHLHNVWLISTGELNKNKNYEAAINAVAEFNSTHSTKIFYVVIAQGDLLNTLKEQVELKGLKDYVYFKGYVENVRQYLLAFDMFLMPSLKEGLPYGLLEAGLAKLPCIASKVGGIPEVITDGESGLLINPQNHMSVVEALDYLLTNPDKRSIFSDNLAEDIKEKFNQKMMVEKTQEVYAR
jgi:glycosyltransferase involved in cell wall biosynthesis